MLVRDRLTVDIRSVYILYS